MDTAQLRADFDRDGYVVCRGALDGYDFGPLRRLIERQVEGQAERLADVRGDAFDAHEQAPFETRWAELAREFAADPTVPEDRRALVNATWGGMDMLDEATHALYTCAPCKTIAQTLLGPEVQANGDCKQLPFCIFSEASPSRKRLRSLVPRRRLGGYRDQLGLRNPPGQFQLRHAPRVPRGADAGRRELPGE